MEKLFLINSCIKGFKSDIERIEEKDGHIVVVLDRAAFFPEGGGQISDTGP